MSNDTARRGSTAAAGPDHSSAWRRAVARWELATAARASGLPNLHVLTWFPIVVVLIGVVLVALGISGTSTGTYWQGFGVGADPSLLLGMPRQIRSDEWLVQTSWVISQVQQGFPVLNHTLPGGMDATIQNDLPSWDWSSLFRPHVLGFLVLPLDQGVAVRWWLPAIATIVAAYAFVVTLVPRRPVLAAVVAIAVPLSPMIQWWFLPTTIWPVAWAFTALTAIIWCLRSSKRWVRWVVAGAAAYLTVTMVMSIYVPYMIPAVLTVVVVGLSFIVGNARSVVVDDGIRARTALLGTVRRVLPLIATVVAAAVVLVVWIVTRRAVIDAVLDTVYPGQRLGPTGPESFGLGISNFSGPFQRALQGNVSSSLGPNQAEAAAPIMTALFLLSGLVWCIVLAARRRRVDWPVAGTLVTLGVVLAFLLVPHWDAIAHLLFIDRTTDARMRLAFDVLGPIAIGLVVRRLDAAHTRVPWSVSLYGPVLVVATAGAVYIKLRLAPDTSVLSSSGAWRLVVVLVAVGVLLVLRRSPTVGAVLLLAATAIVGLQVNPLYKGVYDLNDTRAGRDIARVEAKDPDAQWVGIGSTYSTPLLVESGVTAFNGVQTYPPRTMWREIDPTGQYENAWNRLANVSWVVGSGEPVVSNPVRDQVQVTFDACSAFAQRHVDYVLSDTPIQSSCLTEVDDARQGATDFTIYRVR